MTISELIERLSALDPSLEVRTESGEGLSEIALNTHQPDQHAIWLCFYEET